MNTNPPNGTLTTETLPAPTKLDTPAGPSADGAAKPPAQGDGPVVQPRALFDPHEALIARRLELLSSPPVAIPIILTVGVLMFIVNLGGAPLYTKGEPREAVTVFDIVHGGGIILPLRAGVEIPSKPLLMHWLAAIVSVIAGGVSAWTVRLPSATFAIGGMIVTYLYVRKMFEARG